MTDLKKGDKSPDFMGIDQNGHERKLDDYKGKKLVLYFLPKRQYSGCTAEACDLRNNYEKFLAKGYHILGVSPDSQASHQKFIAKYNLPFDLIADTEKKIANLFGVWGEKKMYGKTYMGILRTTFIINEEGDIERHY